MIVFGIPNDCWVLTIRLWGVLLVDEQFVHLFTKERESLFASILTAVTHAMNQILKRRPRHLELEDMHLYLSYKDPYILALITDVESDMFLELADSITSELADSGITPEQINFDPVTKQLVKQLIRKGIMKQPPSIKHLAKLVSMLKSISEFIKVAMFVS